MDDDLAFREARISVREVVTAGVVLAALAGAIHVWGERALIGIGVFTIGYLVRFCTQK